MSKKIADAVKRNIYQPVTAFILFFSFIASCTHSTDSKPFNYFEDSTQIAILLDSMEILINTNNSKLAYQQALHASQLYKNSAYIPGKAMILQRLATLNYLYELNLDSSVYYLNQLHSLSTKHGFEKGLIWYHHTLGKVYYTQNDYAKAERFYKNAYHKAVAKNDSTNIAEILTSLSKILGQQQKTDSAKVLIKEALRYTRSTDNATNQIVLYSQLGKYYASENNLDSAIYAYSKALNDAQKINNKLSILLCEFNINLLKYLQQPNMDICDSIILLQETAKKEGFQKTYINASYLLSQIYEHQGEYKKALDEYKKAQETEDTLIGNENVRQVVEQEAQFYLEEKEAENQQLIQEAIIKNLKLKNRKIVILFTLATLTISIFLLLIIYRKYQEIKQNLATIQEQERLIFEQEKVLIEKEKEAIEEKLKTQQRELTCNLMRLYSHQEIISDTITQINSIQKKIKEGATSASLRKQLQRLTTELGQSDNERIWHEFESQFNETNPKFLKQLLEQFPNLTNNDIRLCIFLKLNLRSKEISVITQQSLKSIEVARTRLRNKLGLSNTNTNLVQFLNQL